MISLRGWIELDGTVLSVADLERLLAHDATVVNRFGGEFLLSWDMCTARDLLGIIPGPVPPGTILCNGEKKGEIHPDPPLLTDLGEAIAESVRLRSGTGITALSGGVDSCLVAHFAGLPCLTAGAEDSHDIERGRRAAELLGLPCEYVTITRRDVEEGLAAVIPVIPKVNPVEVSIAVTQYCITRWAGEHGYERILTGQGADELFGGYARYLESEDLERDLERDFEGLKQQALRDQSVAALHGTYLSMPYLDTRVVRAARSIPASGKVAGGVRKLPLREVAARHIPPELAWHDKKAMQYGSGVWKIIRELARHNGYKRSVQGYINQFELA
jgi:asparagine synthase (glutamine-hydrolysing)